MTATHPIGRWTIGPKIGSDAESDEAVGHLAEKLASGVGIAVENEQVLQYRRIDDENGGLQKRHQIHESLDDAQYGVFLRDGAHGGWPGRGGWRGGRWRWRRFCCDGVKGVKLKKEKGDGDEESGEKKANANGKKVARKGARKARKMSHGEEIGRLFEQRRRQEV